MYAERFQDVEESEQPKRNRQKPGVGEDDFGRDEGQAHEDAADLVDDDPAGVFGAGVLHRLVHERDGCEENNESCNEEKPVRPGAGGLLVDDVGVLEPVSGTQDGHGVGDNRSGKASHSAGCLGRHSRTEERHDERGEQVRPAPLVRHALLSVFFFQFFFIHSGRKSSLFGMGGQCRGLSNCILEIILRKNRGGAYEKIGCLRSGVGVCSLGL